MADFFPRRLGLNPTIYAYSDSHPEFEGLLKVGYTATSAKKRIAQQYPTKAPGKPVWQVVLEEPAVRSDGSTFMDHEVHRHLRKCGLENPDGEWFRCTAKEVKAAILAIRNRESNDEGRTWNFKMRPEQAAAVEKASGYFRSFEGAEEGVTPHFLWNAKMRFGKTFAAYQLAKTMDWKKILVLTFKPAVQSAWEEDLLSHVDFKGWQFLSSISMFGARENLTIDEVDNSKPIVCFGSFQDYLGKNSAGGIKAKNEWVHATNWDCVVFDEYHYGAWRENAKDLFEGDSEKMMELGEVKEFHEDFLPITSNAYLYLSGTPFRAITSGEFIEEQMFNWTYNDEQKAKESWGEGPNPYFSLPRMVMLTYQLPSSIRDIALGGDFDEFDLNTFFVAEGEGEHAKFKHEDEVQKWLDLIRGSFEDEQYDRLRLGTKKPPMPFSHAPLLAALTHTLWFLPRVASCHAMRNLLLARQNKFYHSYRVVVAAGGHAGQGVKALTPVEKAMGNPLATKTITLTCGKLTTGVSVKPWSGIFMLRNTSSPETYFQAAFRVQTPWTVKNQDGTSPNKEDVLKEECYVFDFAPNRALAKIADYSCRLNVNEANPEKKVAEFIKFLPVLAYDGSSMKRIDAAGVLDMAMSGTTSSLLARKWESALLVNVDNVTLQKLIGNEAAMQALMNIEGFRSLNQDIETIINKSEAIKKVKEDANDKELSKEDKKALTKEEREYRSLRKEVQDKLIKFATRVPVFMYLTDFRERSLKDVITQLEPGLFRKVTGLTVKDFELLVSLGVFNRELMNEAVFAFKRYEDSSLVYAGINKHEGKDVGGYDTVISSEEFGASFVNEERMV